MAAPASPASMAAAAISCGVVGRFGFWALRGHDPVVAAEMMTASLGNVACGLGSLMARRGDLARAVNGSATDYTRIQKSLCVTQSAWQPALADSTRLARTCRDQWRRDRAR